MVGVETKTAKDSMSIPQNLAMRLLRTTVAVRYRTLNMSGGSSEGTGVSEVEDRAWVASEVQTKKCPGQLSVHQKPTGQIQKPQRAETATWR